MTNRGLVSALLPLLGDVLAKEVAERLAAVVGGEGWKKAALALVADAVKKEGLAGLVTAAEALFEMADGKPPKIDWADLETASGILAEMENVEADRKNEIRKFLAEVGQVLGIVCAAAIKAVL